MIKVNELRIGNWVAFGVNKVTIRCIHQDTMLDDKEPHVYVNGFAQFKSYCLLQSQVEPIPLTPEILEKITRGYDSKSTLAKIHITPLFYISIFLGIGRLVYNERNISDKEYYYLHQLQNIYFALTGEELTYTP